MPKLGVAHEEAKVSEGGGFGFPEFDEEMRVLDEVFDGWYGHRRVAASIPGQDVHELLPGGGAQIFSDGSMLEVDQE